jgi:hypothetical protein
VRFVGDQRVSGNVTTLPAGAKTGRSRRLFRIGRSLEFQAGKRDIGVYFQIGFAGFQQRGRAAPTIRCTSAAEPARQSLQYGGELIGAQAEFRSRSEGKCSS